MTGMTGGWRRGKKEKRGQFGSGNTGEFDGGASSSVRSVSMYDIFMSRTYLGCQTSHGCCYHFKLEFSVEH